MHVETTQKKYVFHYDANIFQQGIQEEEYDKLYDFIENMKKQYGSRNVSMRCEKKHNYSRLEIIVTEKKPKLFYHGKQGF